MSELTVDVVDDYTHGRLSADDAETARLLAAAIDAARRYCGWHVTPVVDEQITIDGPGSRLLVLPTLALDTLTSVIEDGVELDLTTLTWSTRGLVRKRYAATCWAPPNRSSWTFQYGALVVTMTHGFADAPWFDSAVLSIVDRTSQTIGSAQRETVGPFSFAETPTAAASAFTSAEKMILDKYKLEWMP